MSEAGKRFRIERGRWRWRRLLPTVCLIATLLAPRPGEEHALAAVCDADGATPVGETAASPGPLVVAGDPIASLVPAPTGATAFYAIGGRGLYRSDDGGKSWRCAGLLPLTGQIVAALDDPRVLLAGEHPPCAKGEDKVAPGYRSVDGGATWEEVPAGSGIRPLAIWSEASLALGAGCAGLQVSLDGGRTWQPAPFAKASYEVTAFAPVSGTGERRQGLVVETSEGGTSQLRLLDLSDSANPTIGGLLLRFWGVGAPVGRDGLSVVGTSHGVVVSVDGGATWQASRQGLEAVTLSVDPMNDVIPESERARGYGIFAVALDPTLPDRLYAGAISGLFVSDDLGATWARLPGVNGSIAALAVGADLLFAQTGTGVVAVLRPA